VSRKDKLIKKMKELGFVYTSLDNPTCEDLEAIIKATEECDKEYPIEKIKEILAKGEIVRK